MTIQEALKSCRPVKLPHWRDDYFVCYDMQNLLSYSNGKQFNIVNLSAKEILRTDWQFADFESMDEPEGMQSFKKVQP